MEPYLSIVIPIYNEEEILENAVAGLLRRLDLFEWSVELILAENGSQDRTLDIARTLADNELAVSHISFDSPNYGRALKQGILAAQGEFVICDEIDLCDTDFYERAMTILESDRADLVVGSKTMAGARDQRPLTRRLITHGVNAGFRLAYGFRGTDTHGIKAFRRERLVGVARACVVDKDLFATELVIRAQRDGARIKEIPVTIEERRRTPVALIRRVPHALAGMMRLMVVLRSRG